MIEVEGASLQTEMVKIANSKETENIILSQLAKNDPNHKINKIQLLIKPYIRALRVVFYLKDLLTMMRS